MKADPERRRLAGLFALARRLRSELSPIEPPPKFVADLKRQLVANADRARAAAQRKRLEMRRVVIAAGAGGAVYLVGLASVVLRVGVSLAALAAAVLSRRRREPVGEQGASEPQ